MKKKTKCGLNLTPDQRFLFERLPDVVRLEKAMDDIRRKYTQYWDGICRRVQLEHPTLDCPCNHAAGIRAQFGLGRVSWPSAYPLWPSGLYIYNISFESLCSPDSASPGAGIWIKPPKGSRINIESLKKQNFLQKAERKLGQKLQSENNSEIWFWFDLPESRDQLLAMLTKEEAKFADCMVVHFGKLAKLIPLIDEVFRVKLK